MKDTLVAGIAASERLAVDRDRSIGFLGEEARVYATPSLVRDIEQCCRDAVLAHLDEGEDTVGTFVDIEHLAATPMGMWVEIAVELTAVEGRRLTFGITARDPVDEPVARGTHGRFVVDKARTAARIAAKKARA